MTKTEQARPVNTVTKQINDRVINSDLTSEQKDVSDDEHLTSLMGMRASRKRFENHPDPITRIIILRWFDNGTLINVDQKGDSSSMTPRKQDYYSRLSDPAAQLKVVNI